MKVVIFRPDATPKAPWGPRHRDGTARYMENWRTKKRKRKKSLNTNTGMARPDTRKIGGRKKKEREKKTYKSRGTETEGWQGQIHRKPKD